MTDLINTLPDGLLSHLIDLRSRLLRCVVAMLLVFLALVPFSQRLYSWLAQPLLSRLPAGAKLIAIDVSSPFLVPVKLTVLCTILLATPMVLYQLWAFVAPGLYRGERRLAVPLLLSACALFYAGCAFAYFLTLPMVFGFLTRATPEGVSMMTDIGHYLDFVTVILLAFGASFEVPVALVVMVLLGWVTTQQLRGARPYAVVGIFVIAAILAPPDVVSQLMLAVPMCLLYELGLFATHLILRRSTGSPSRQVEYR